VGSGNPWQLLEAAGESRQLLEVSGTRCADQHYQNSSASWTGTGESWMQTKARTPHDDSSNNL